MSRRPRRSHTGASKAKVALEAVILERSRELFRLGIKMILPLPALSVLTLYEVTQIQEMGLAETC